MIVQSLRRTLGMAKVAAHLARGALTMLFIMPYVGVERRQAIVARWSRQALAIFRFDLHAHRVPMPGDGQARLFVANHISWLDIFACLSVTPMRFVAKSEVRSWPLIGWFAVRLGTIFIVRDSPRDAVRVAAEMRTALEAGVSVCVFPEGATSDGSQVLPFSAVLFGPVIASGTSVIPMAIAYRSVDGKPTRRAAFTDDATLLASIWSLAGADPSEIQLWFLPPLSTTNETRRSIAGLSETAIRSALTQNLHTSSTAPGNAPASSPESNQYEAA